MSGGIDSSVAAALLKRAEFNVVGVFLKLADLPRFKKGEKTARKVAKKLKIPLLVLDLRKEFQKRIVNEFLKEYKSGRTPNPCVVCNREMKFIFLLRIAKKLGARYVATGHYACLSKGKLLKGKDKEKDQSYFLWQLNQKQLNHILFPVGNYTKKEVRSLAKKFGLPILEAPESQEICFIPVPINVFLEKHLKLKPGQIINTQGKTLGKHQGLFFYTIGQRKGIKLPGGPYYVLRKELKDNLLVVTKNEKDLLNKELTAKMVNWISEKKPKFPLRIKAKIRYRHKAVPAIVIKQRTGKRGRKKYKVIFDKPQRAVTPGQSVVFYSSSQILRNKTWEGKGEELLGGGIID